jgi:site-specific DNA recombinase
MRTAVYLRVSTEEQAAEGFSIAAQREKLLAYVNSQGWTLADVYADEGYSAKNTSRPELERLLADMRAGRVDVVLVYRLDRLTRSVLDLYQLLQEFDRHGVRFKSCTEVYDTTTAIGRLFITLVAALAQWERENLAERVKLGMGQMARERKRPGGPAPYGYTIADGKLHVHPREAEVVQYIFRRYLLGFRPRQIADDLNNQGIRGKTGSPWSASTISHVLRNPVYYGALRWNYAERGQRLHPPEEWVLMEDSHPAIIDPQTFRQAQQMMEKRRGVHPRSASSDFVFAGIVHCARCGSAMSGKTARTRKANGKQYVNRYYLCKNKQTGACSAPAIREDLLEQHLTETMRRYRDEIQAALRATSPARSSSASSQEQLQKLREKRRRWEEAYSEGVLTLEEFRRKLTALGEAEATLRKAAAAGESAAVSPDKHRELLSDFSLVWNCATPEERKQIASLLVRKIEAEVHSDNQSARRRSLRLHRIDFY